MKFAGNNVRTAFFSALNEQISYSDADIKCYDTKAPKGAAKPYILLGNYTQNNSNAGTKDSFGANVTMTLEVVNVFNDNSYERTGNDFIANGITEKLRPAAATKGLTITGFDVLTLNVSGTYDNHLETDIEDIFRTIMIFQLEINEQ